jgi:hypothetical protein
MIVRHRQFIQAFTPSPDVVQSQECMHLILKLRWMGLHDEADRLERAARIVAPDDGGTVLAEPASTD